MQQNQNPATVQNLGGPPEPNGFNSMGFPGNEGGPNAMGVPGNQEVAGSVVSGFHIENIRFSGNLLSIWLDAIVICSREYV